LKEVPKPRVFENSVLRRIFRPKRDEVTWQSRKLHNEELNDFYSSPNNVRVIKWRIKGWADMYRIWKVYSFWVGKPEGKRPFGRPRRR
jgi:hypothetical protein